ncbi:MAG: GTP-binding protein [Clostridia bacterium]|nr:GTP-binding protein [Clostridia bacterium]
MIKVDIFSGFLGAGKTTLIKKLIKEAYSGEKLVIIENEFGQIGIDGGFLSEAGIEITEMNSGCICCSLVGDFGEALKKVTREFSPDRIIIEPSGVGKLSDVIKAVQDAEVEGLELNSFTTVIDASKCKIYMKNFAEFYSNQIEFASAIIMSRTSGIAKEKLDSAVEIIRELNSSAALITTPWEELDGKTILDTIEKKNSLDSELKKLLEEQKEHHHHHHHHDEDCGCHHEHHHDEECECHHEHHHDEECECHHGHHDEDCGCHHHHHEHHHADDVFTSWGVETSSSYTVDFIKNCLNALDGGKYGVILRAKGIVACSDGGWIHFDYVPEEIDIRMGTADVIGKLCVIGAELDKEAISELFAI